MSHKFPEIKVNPDLVLVGEIVIFKNGVSDFHLAQSRTQNEQENKIRAMVNPATFMAFDVLEIEGRDVSKLSQNGRKALLNFQSENNKLGQNVQEVLGVHVKFATTPLETIIEKVIGEGREGLIVKDVDAPYTWGAKSKSSRPRHWFKVVPWYDVVVPIDKFEETGVGKGFVLYITTPGGYQQKVVCNSYKMRARVESGEAKWVKVKYKSVEEPSGAFRQPSTVEVYAEKRESSRQE